MAERRMFAKTIVLSDAFLDLPLGSRCLYYTLGMLADDDGFVNSPEWANLCYQAYINSGSSVARIADYWDPELLPKRAH